MGVSSFLFYWLHLSQQYGICIPPCYLEPRSENRMLQTM